MAEWADEEQEEARGSAMEVLGNGLAVAQHYEDAQATHFAFNSLATNHAPFSAKRFGKEKRSFDDWSAPPVYALDENEDKPTLFITNLAWTITSEALFAKLGGIGSVVACEVKRNGKGQSKGFALATFQSEEASQRAIAEFHGVVLEGRRLSVRPDAAERDRPREPKSTKIAPSARVFVGNVPFATTQEEFARVFGTRRWARGARPWPWTRRASRAAMGSCGSRTRRPRRRRSARSRASKSAAGPCAARPTSGPTTTARARPPPPPRRARGSTGFPREVCFLLW